MKINAEQKKENRKKIIHAAVDLIILKNLKAATMREIAQKAGLGDATIYNYFPTKESIVFGYYEDQFNLVVDHLKGIDNFNEFTFQEQLQAFFEGKLELYLPDREFISKTFKTVFFSMGQNFSKMRPIRDKFLDIINDIFDAAVEAGEIPDQVFREITYQLFWDYYVGVVAYWLGDKSDRFTETSIMIDKSLDLACAVIKSGIGNKIFDMATFLFKNHILGRLDFFKEKADTIQKFKRSFMGTKNDK